MIRAADILAGGVRAYQLTVRPLIGGHCRFEPSCSHYAIEALRRHGAARGVALTAGRVLRCNPWNEGGYDPVPPIPSIAAPGGPRRDMADDNNSHARTAL